VIHPGVGFAVADDQKSDAHTAAATMRRPGPDPVAPINGALSAALEHAFIEPESAPHRYTKAAVILQYGHIVGQRYAPGSEWQYTNCNFVLLSRIIRDAVAGNPEVARQFIERELFGPLGFEHATLEFDSVGTPLGAIQLWASARDWAFFGLLYLRDGVSTNGQRILPEGWVDYSARLTPQSNGYGAGFWTQRGNSSDGRERLTSGMPADGFMASGSQGQYTIILPSEDLVIVRLGWSYTPDDDVVATRRLTREVIAALHADQ